jgi:RND family efflux transporter MFP subunit
MVAWLHSQWKHHRAWFVVASVLAVAAAAFGASRLGRNEPTLPMTEVRRGVFVETVQLRGEVRALKSIYLTAPFGAGDIQILELAKTGTAVKQGDVVVQMDSTQLQRQLEQRRSDLKTADGEIERTIAQARITEEQNLTAVQQARYNVERARLEASKQEILSAIEGEKTKLNLANAEQKLREAEQKLASDRTAAEADTAARRKKRERALFEVNRLEKALAALTIRAPVDGVVNVLPNSRGRGPFGGAAPDYRPGDRAWPGALIAELPDLSKVLVYARVDEADRGRTQAGQTATVRVDAVPDKEFRGKVVEISPMAKPDYSGWPPVKNFDLSIELEGGDPRLRPGMTAAVRVAVASQPDALLVPAEAVFQRNGRSVVYVRRGSHFDERVVQIARRGNGQAVIAQGLREGESVATKNPMLAEAGVKP